MNEEILLKLWAKTKPFHPLWCHLLDAAAACQALLPHFGGIENVSDSWVCFFVGAHDIGKADDWFQNKDEGLAGVLNDLGLRLPAQTAFRTDDLKWFRHEARSAEWIRGFLVERGWKGRGAAQVVANAINGHHGDFSVTAYKEDSQRTQMWNELRAELTLRLWRVLQPEEDFALDAFTNASVAGLKLSALIVLSDWLASNHDLWHYDNLPYQASVEDYWQATSQRAVEVVERLHFAASPPVPHLQPMRFGEVWPQMSQSPRPAQAALEKEVLKGIPPGLCLIEAPMGEGKTEAAIYLASEWNRQLRQSGAYLALPTQATSNQMYTRYRDFLKSRGQDEPKLVHGMAWLIDKSTFDAAPELSGETPQDQQLALEWFRPLRRALLAPDGVGTIDQVLMAALDVKFGFLRLLGLGRKVLIVDEVHAYDDYMTAILERLLQWCGAANIGVILLSATLSYGQKRRLLTAYSGNEVQDEKLSFSRTNYPLLTFCETGGQPREEAIPIDKKRERTLELKLHSGLLEDAFATAALAWQIVRDGGNLCVLCNTVKSAQDIFEELSLLSKQDKGTELNLFHARFRTGQRSAVERKIIEIFGKDAGEKRPQRSITVTTQVVEQSLDVDFDFMMTQISPVDLLLQRSGRLHRHPPKTRAVNAKLVLHILLPLEDKLQFGATEKVYEREILLRTLSYLYKDKVWKLPDDFRILIEGVYAREMLPNNLIPGDDLEKAACERVPRVCGDEPIKAGDFDMDEQCSPRVRG